MTDNGKIARWQGVYPNPPKYRDEADNDAQCPDYLNDDASAMSLLDTLAEKGYLPELVYLNCKHWQCEAWKGNDLHAVSKEPTIRESVVAAVLQLISDKP